MKQLVTQSNVQAARDPLFPNCLQQPTLADGDTSAPVKKPVISTIQDYYDSTVHLPVFSPDELLRMMVLRTVDETVCARVVRKILDCDADNHSKIKFLLSLGDGQLEEIISYNELSDLVVEAQES